LTTLSKTQIDRLGDRLRKGSPSQDDLKLLDEYRRSFGEAYEASIRIIREQLKLEPTGRPAKSTSSLIEKLHRESIRLSQVQDIAGCRVIVDTVAEQDRVVASLASVFPGASVVDRRANPSYGYRAVHVIAEIFGKLIEIQVRTPLQHLWAEVSEKFSDVFDPAIKYGGGNDKVRELLTRASELVPKHEVIIVEAIADLKKKIADIPQDLPQQFPREYQQLQETLQELVVHHRDAIARCFGKLLSWVNDQKREKP
jgi:putative GTP pyrophosphokinase